MTSDRDRWDARHMAADDVDPRPSELLDAFAQRLPPGGRALDLACGRGRNAVHLARLGFLVDAVDVSTIGLAMSSPSHLGFPPRPKAPFAMQKPNPANGRCSCTCMAATATVVR